MLVKKYEVEFNKVSHLSCHALDSSSSSSSSHLSCHQAALSLAESFTNPNQKKLALNRLLKDNVALIGERMRGGAV